MLIYHIMPKTKVAVTLDSGLLDQLDALVQQQRFPSRCQAIEAALAEKLERVNRARLARECAKLDPSAERAFAEKGLSEDSKSWTAY